MYYFRRSKRLQSQKLPQNTIDKVLYMSAMLPKLFQKQNVEAFLVTMSTLPMTLVVPGKGWQAYQQACENLNSLRKCPGNRDVKDK